MKPSWTNRDVLPVLLPRSDRTPLAWKNGGGVSFDIARGSGRGPDGFDWRIGIAAIDTAGAFSSYAGYARCLWLMSGAGLALDIGGKAGAWIDRPGEGIVFDGAAIVTSRLLRGHREARYSCCSHGGCGLVAGADAAFAMERRSGGSGSLAARDQPVPALRVSTMLLPDADDLSTAS